MYNKIKGVFLIIFGECVKGNIWGDLEILILEER
jgi:hypothetical protein